jgi:cobalt/nickel transport system ATP-binding protein
LHIFNLQSLQFNSPLHLSHGQQTKTAFAAILSHNPELVILDEPTQGQDPSAIKYLISFLKSLAIAGKAVVILSHNIDFLRLVSNRILVLNGGGLKELC